MGGSQHQRSFPRRVVEMAPILSDYCRVVCALTYSSGTEENFIILRRFEGAGEPAKSINQRPTKHYRHGVCHVIDLEQLFVKVCLQHRDASKSSTDALQWRWGSGDHLGPGKQDILRCWHDNQRCAPPSVPGSSAARNPPSHSARQPLKHCPANRHQPLRSPFLNASEQVHSRSPLEETTPACSKE
jgi:hypothetical protein